MVRSGQSENAKQLARSRLQLMRGVVRQRKFVERLGLVPCAVLVGLPFAAACGPDYGETIRVSERRIEVSSPEHDSLQQLVDSLSARVDAYRRRGILPLPPYSPFVAETDSAGDRDRAVRLEGQYLLLDHYLLVEVRRLSLTSKTSAEDVEVAFLRVGTDSCGDARFPYGVPPSREVAVDWAVPSGMAELSLRLTVRIEGLPVDASACRLWFQLLDVMQRPWADLVGRRRLRYAPYRAWSLALSNRRMKLADAVGLEGLAAW